MQSTAWIYTLAVLIWGSTWILVKFQLGVVSPILSVCYRFLLASAVLFVYCWLSQKPLRLNRSQHVMVALLGTFSFSGSYVLYYHSAQYVTTGLIAIIYSLLVGMNMINGAILYRKPIEKRVIVGALLGGMGLCLVFYNELSGVNYSATFLTGLLLAVTAVFVSSLGNMASIACSRLNVPVIQANAFGMLYAAILTFLFAMLKGVPINFEWTFTYISSLSYLALLGSVVAFGCYFTLIQRIGADRAAYISVLFPIIALIISTVFEAYQWTFKALAGVVLILLGNVVVLTKFKVRDYLQRMQKPWLKNRRSTL